MALVDALLRALPRPDTPDPRLLEAALGKPRVRGIAEEIDRDAREQTARAEGALRRGLRKARALHSRERRLVGDVLRELARHDHLLDTLLDNESGDFLTRWIGWLVLCGATVERAETAWRADRDGPAPPFERLVDLEASVRPILEQMEPVQAISFVGSLAPSVAAALVETYGPEDAAAFITASNERAELELRANSARIERDRLQGKLGREGLRTGVSDIAPYGLVALDRVNLDNVPSYKSGLVEVQDAGSQVLAELVDPDAGPIIDFCAGAGGKTLALAALMKGKGRIVSLDIRDRAIDELKKRCKRARVYNVVATSMAASGPLPWQAWNLEGQATRVLIDAPCSGSGVLRRHPEYRWRLDQVGHLEQLQRDILKRSAPLVAPGGRLIYATCSVLARENEAIVEAFLADHPEFTLVPVTEVLGDARAEALACTDTLRLAPHTHGTDGFFGAVMRRAE